MKKLKLVIVISASILLTQTAYATNIVGIVSYSIGDVLKIQSGNKQQSGRITTIKNNDIIETDQLSKVAILLNDGSQLIIFEKSSVQFNVNHNQKISRLNLIKGSIWCLKKKSNFLMHINSLGNSLSTDKAVFRVIGNKTTNELDIYVSNDTLTLLNADGALQLSAGQKYRLATGIMKSKQDINQAIFLSSEQKQYYIPKSGKFPIQIHAQLNSEYLSNQAPKQLAMLISDASNLIIDDPLLRFKLDAIDFTITTIDEGNPTIHVVMDAPTFVDGTDGSLQLKIHSMSKIKILKIKTSRGDIKIKMFPKK